MEIGKKENESNVSLLFIMTIVYCHLLSVVSC